MAVLQLFNLLCPQPFLILSLSNTKKKFIQLSKKKSKGKINVF